VRAVYWGLGGLATVLAMVVLVGQGDLREQDAVEAQLAASAKALAAERAKVSELAAGYLAVDKAEVLDAVVELMESGDGVGSVDVPVRHLETGENVVP